MNRARVRDERRERNGKRKSCRMRVRRRKGLSLTLPGLSPHAQARGGPVEARPCPAGPDAAGAGTIGTEKGQGKRKPVLPPANPRAKDSSMNSDAEVEQLRASVHCAALLEHLTAPWRLDKRESTQNCLKYRRGAGETLIVNHQGRGWWDPNSSARGDVFALVQHLEPGLNFGQFRKVLRQFAGLSPTFPEARRARQGKMAPDLPPAARWARCPKLRKGTPGWTYLATQRALPANVLAAASAAAVVRQGAYGNPWFAHRDEAGHVSHVEIRGPDFKGSLRGGTKILFRFPGGMAPPTRLVLTEAPIDAL